MTGDDTRWVDLPERQHEVFDLLIEGLTNRQIGRRLKITEDTVKTHVRRIFAAVGATSRTEATYLVLSGQVCINGGPILAAPVAQQAAAFTPQEARAARDLWAELGRQPAALATPEQLLAFMRACPDELGVKYAARIVEAQQAQARCFQADHEGLVAEFWARERQLAEARARESAA